MNSTKKKVKPISKKENCSSCETDKKKGVGRVTAEEKDEIQFLFERKNGLLELFKSLNKENEFLYDKIVNDMGAVSTQFQNWWDKKSKKYKWEGNPDSHWEINFETCEIFLVKNL